MKTVSKSFTVSFPLKTVAAAFVSADFFKSAGFKPVSITGGVGTKYKIEDRSGVILANVKNKMLVRTLRYASMAKEEQDAVSVFTFNENEEKTETTINMTIVNLSDTLAAAIPSKMKEIVAALKTYLTTPAAKKGPAAKTADKKAPAKRGRKAGTAAKTAKKPRAPKAE